MQNCPLETAQIAFVIALNAQIAKFTGLCPEPPHSSPGTPVVRVLILGMSAFVTKLSHYPKKPTAKSA